MALAAAGIGVGSMRVGRRAISGCRRRSKPRRIVSLDLCTDQLLVELVARERIAAVTHLLADPAVSAIPEKGARHARHARRRRGCAAPRSRSRAGGAVRRLGTVDLLRRLGRNVVVVPLPQDLDGVRAAVRTVAAAVGEKAKGEAMIADFDRRLAKPRAARARCGSRPPSSTRSAARSRVPGSLADAALAAAGFRNMAADYPPDARRRRCRSSCCWHVRPICWCCRAMRDEYRTAVADNLRHPVIGLLRQRRRLHRAAVAACGCAARRTSSRRWSGWPRRAAGIEARAR